jgi:hypothetical protein
MRAQNMEVVFDPRLNEDRPITAVRQADLEALYWRSSQPQVQREKFSELVYVGWQSDLRRDGHGGLAVPEAPSSDSGVTLHPMLRTPGVPYAGLPEEEKNVCRGVSEGLLNFLVQVVHERLYVAESTIAEGCEYVYAGHVQGKVGRPDGVYNYNNPEQREQYLAFSRFYNGWSDEDTKFNTQLAGIYAKEDENGRKKVYVGFNEDLSGYMRHTNPELRETYETIVDLGMMALRRRQSFPYPFLAGQLDWNDLPYIDHQPGIREAEMRGLAAVQRVADIVGPTERQELLLGLSTFVSPREY